MIPIIKGRFCLIIFVINYLTLLESTNISFIMLIVLEGLDGAGKSTQVQMLQKYMLENGTETRFLHFPRFDAPVYGDLIARFLRGDLGSIDSVHPVLVALLFAGDRKEASDTIRNWLSSGYCVILDRYIYSNIAFQCAKTIDKNEADWLRNWILDLEYNKFKIPVPDINIFLDVPLTFVKSKLSSGRSGDDREYLEGKQDIHEENLSFQEKVREIYLRECTSESELLRVDCSDINGNMLSPDDIFKKIKMLL